MAVPTVGWTKMGRAETQRISQDAGILFFQREEFLAASQAAFHFHGLNLPHSQDIVKAGVYGFVQDNGGNGSWFGREYEIGQSMFQRQEFFHRRARNLRWPHPKSCRSPNRRRSGSNLEKA